MSAPVLTFRAVSLAFGGLHVVDGLDFELESGARCGLIGPNGAGKTSALNLITGVYPPTSGDILFEGRSISDRAIYQRGCLGIGRTFQNLRLMKHLSVLENVMLGQHRFVRWPARMSLPLMLGPSRGWRQSAMTLIERLGMAADAHVLASDLSYGKQKRVELARALATRPKLLLLDEPAAGLNSAERLELVSAVKDVVPRGTALLVIEHDIDFVEALCDRVMAMNFGRKIADGRVAEVCTDAGVIEAYLGRDDQAEELETATARHAV